MKFSIKNRTTAVFIWVFLILLLSGLSLLKIRNGFNIETNILKMLPSDNENHLLNEASDKFSEKLSRSVLFIITHENRDSALGAAAILKNELSNQKLFKTFHETDWYDFYFNHRFNTVTPALKDALKEQYNLGSLKSYLYRNLFSPMANFYGEMLNKDPLMLFPQFVNSIVAQKDRFDYENGNIIIDDTSVTTVLVSTVLKENGFEKEVQVAFNDFFGKQEIKISDSTGAHVEFTGVVAYASRYMERAKFETGFIGLLSFLTIIILILFAFRSFKSLFWGAIPIFVALLCGTTASILVFDKLHMISLTMGTCLIGICIDYSFHYLSEYTFCKGVWDSTSGLKRILPGISMGAITTIMGYLTFFFIPFTGLKQIAVFTIAGLAGAYFTVVILFPLVFRKGGKYVDTYRFLRPLIFNYFRLFEKKAFRYSFFIALILIIISGLLKVSFIDDMKVFEMQTADLDKTVAKVKELTGVQYERAFLLISGESEEKLLQNVEAVDAKLQKLRENGDISDYLSLSKFVPSIETQKNNYELLASNFLTQENRIKEIFLETGFKAETIDLLLDNIRTNEEKYITIDEWLQSPVSVEYEKLWIGEMGGQYFSAVLLSEIKNMGALESIINEDQNTRLIDNKTRIAQLIENLRINLLRFLPVLCSIVLLSLVLRYGFKKGLSVLTPSLMSFLLTISIFSFASIEVNIMHILALILVLALGIDYSIFLVESKENPSVTCTSILLSATTTIFSFGMLALSMITALRSIGLTILIGISLTLFLTPMAADRKKLLRIF